VIIIGIVLGVHLLTAESDQNEPVKTDLSASALGKAIATAIHQTVTDPYFVPLEQLLHFLENNPETDEIRVDLMTKWAGDNYMPVSFVRDLIMNTTHIDHPVSPWALEEAAIRAETGAWEDNPSGLLQITTFESDQDKYWLGYIKVPYKSTKPRQVAGVFFSVNEYLERDVPRFLHDMIHRARFPLVQFQANQGITPSTEISTISFRILTEKGEVYFQQGQDFEPEKLIYAESNHYPEPIVCLQLGWDLEIFSNIHKFKDDNIEKNYSFVIIFCELVLIALVYWWSVKEFE